MSDEIRAKLAEDLLTEAPWEALDIHFRNGALLSVRGHDLLEVAYALAVDDTDLFRDWLGQGVVARVTPDEAARWKTAKASFDAIIVQPWVLLAVPADA